MLASSPRTPSTVPDVSTVAITGARGFLGAHLVQHCAARGWNVVALARGPELAPQERVRWVEHDLAGPLDHGVLAGVDYLVHAAYVKHGAAADAYRVNVEGARRLLEASRASGVRRNVFISSLAARADAASTYGRQKFEIEGMFETPRDTVVRAGLVIGDGGLVRETVALMRRTHVVPLVAGGRQPIQVVGVGDVVSAITLILENDLAGMFILADPHPTTYSAFYRAVSQSLGMRVLFVPVPAWLLLAAIRLARRLRVSLGVTEDNLRGIQQASVVDSAASLARMGVQLSTFDETLGYLAQRPAGPSPSGDHHA